MATKAQVENFINTIGPLAIKQYQSGKLILPSVCIAQGACESAWGTSRRMVDANALFGFKVGKSKYHFGTAWKDKAYSTLTHECYDGKNYVAITDMFRAYDSIDESVEDYYDLLTTASRYRNAVGKTNPLETITAIKNGGYATSPTYINTIMSIINSHNLTRFDGNATIEHSLNLEVTPDLDNVVNDVIKGKYGNGETRRIRLTSAGYNYREVQALVNKKLKG